MSDLGFIISDSGTITLNVRGKPYIVGNDHVNYSTIVDELQVDDPDLDYLLELVDIPLSVEKHTEGNVSVVNGNVLYKGTPIHNSLAARIIGFVENKLPYKSLLRFLDNLMDNPSKRAIDELYTFLDHKNLPVTPDGHFLAYKGVTESYLDLHTRSFDNAPGNVHEMPRNKVDDDKERHCSYGFHVGTAEFARRFGPKTVLVKVNPKDAVSVPSDADCQKLRVCKYEVVDYYEKELDDFYEDGWYEEDDEDVWPEEEKDFYGVYYEEGRKNPWRARVHHEGESIHLGYFDEAELAAEAYNDYVQEQNLDKPLNYLP